MFARVRRRLAASVFALALCVSAENAFAQSASDRVYVVQQSDTVSRIAARLQVPVRAVIERNHLEAPYRLRVGRRLRVPDGVPADVLRTLPRRGDPNADVATADANEARSSHSGDDAQSRAGVVTLIRRRDEAELTTRFDNPSQSFRNRIERFLRFRDGSRHNIHPRLIRQLAAVSAHFDGRPIIVLSGFRPQSWRRRGPRTRHSQGYAVDIRIDGVNTRELFNFCESLDDMGCGFYPRARFVHMDVRREAMSWQDDANPGTRHATETVPDSDENVSEVMEDAATVRNGDGGGDGDR